MKRSIRNLVGPLVTAAVVLGMGAAPALAAPQLGVTLESDAGTSAFPYPAVHHSDERVDFTVKAKNEAPPLGAPSEGDELSCATAAGGSGWRNASTIGYSFEFQWVRDGETVVSDWSPPETMIGEVGLGEEAHYIATYTVQAADEGHAIQCLVKATNGAGTGSAVIASQPSLLVEGAGEAPSPNSTSGSRRASISGTANEAGKILTCTAPEAAWSISNEASPITWSFEWMRDGEYVDPGHEHTTESAGPPAKSEYELQATDVEAPAAPAVFQCIAKATNAGGSALVESLRKVTSSPAPAFESNTENDVPLPGNNDVPAVENAGNAISSPLTLELELPGGEGTFAYRFEQFAGGGWSCEKFAAEGAGHANVRCSLHELIPPGAELPALTVATALGADAPDLASARATASGGGSQPASDEVSFPIAPAIPFGFQSFASRLLEEGGTSEYAQAAGHPFEDDTRLLFTLKRPLVPFGRPGVEPVENPKQSLVDLPAGLTGNPLATPELCAGVDQITGSGCTHRSVVGVAYIQLPDTPGELGTTLPIYAVEPEAGAPAQFAFAQGLAVQFVLTPRLRPGDGYALSIETAPAFETGVRSVTTKFCGYGVAFSGEEPLGCKEATDPEANPLPFFTTPTRCDGPLRTTARTNSWADPSFVEASFDGRGMEGCAKVPFDPAMKVTPTTSRADSPTGLEAKVTVPTNGLEGKDAAGNRDPEAIAQSNVKDVKVTLPEGLVAQPLRGQRPRCLL